MQPNTPRDDQPLTVPARDDAPVLSPDREAAARLMREQINSLYDESPKAEEPSKDLPAAKPSKAEKAAAITRTYHQSHSDKKAHDSAATDEHLTRYHTAWQQYYQQYYERYYLSQLARMKPSAATPGEHAPEASPQEELTKDEAVHELRDKLLGEVKFQSEKVRKSRHFMPILSALVVALVFLLLQYNRVMIAQVKSYVSPGAIDPQNIILDPTSTAKVGPEPKLIIPKINVDAPVVYGLGTVAESAVEKNLKNGVVHYELPGADSLPGQKGNTVILGHSSNDVFDDGNYKFVFVQLEKLQVGDIFYLNYNSTRYSYRVSDKKVILPNQVSTLIYPTDKPIVSLVTCVPVGTALKRLIVSAEQISPDPTQASAPAAAAKSNAPASIPGNSPTLLQRILGN
jgi:sortase A